MRIINVVAAVWPASYVYTMAGCERARHCADNNLCLQMSVLTQYSCHAMGIRDANNSRIIYVERARDRDNVVIWI